MRLARVLSATESAVLVLLCLSLIPILALLLALDVFVVTDENPIVTWAAAVLILAAGYGALAAILAAADRHVPYPRRAVFQARAVLRDLRSLSPGGH